MGNQTKVKKSVIINSDTLLTLKNNLLEVYRELCDTELQFFKLLKEGYTVDNVNDKNIDDAIPNSKAIATAIKWYIDFCPFFSTPLGVINYKEEWDRNPNNPQAIFTCDAIRTLIRLSYWFHNNGHNQKKYPQNKTELDKFLPDIFIDHTGTSVKINASIDADDWNTLVYITTGTLQKYSPQGSNYKTHSKNKDAFLFAIEFITSFANSPSTYVTINKNALKLHGNKWNQKMVEAIDQILSSSEYKPNYLIDTCGGALGLSMNITANRYLINDYDSNKVILYNYLQSNFFELIETMYNKYLSNGYDASNFENAYKTTIDANASDIEKASAMLFYYATRDTRFLNSQIQRAKYSEAGIFNLSIYFAKHHRVLKNATIYNMDIIDFLNSADVTNVLNKRWKKPLIVVDPPYYQTAGYSANNNQKLETLSFDKHKQIIDFLINHNTPFLYFYRDNSKINDLFRGKRLYYIDITISNGKGKAQNPIIERIVTNLKVEGLTEIKNLF